MRWSSNEIHNFKYFFTLPIFGYHHLGLYLNQKNNPLKEWSEGEILQQKNQSYS